MFFLIAIAVIFACIMSNSTMAVDRYTIEENIRRNREYYDGMRKLF